MTDAEEQAFEEGRRAGLVAVLARLLQDLGYADRQAAAWVLEREAALVQLREVCAEFGDTDWDETLHLADIIEKHLGRPLRDTADTEAVAILRAIIAASDGCRGHRDCNHSMEPWQRARALLAAREPGEDDA